MFFANTPKVLANVSPGLELREPWDHKIKKRTNPERVRQPPNPFRVGRNLINNPKVLASSNPGLTLANDFGVIFKLNHYY